MNVIEKPPKAKIGLGDSAPWSETWLKPPLRDYPQCVTVVNICTLYLSGGSSERSTLNIMNSGGLKRLGVFVCSRGFTPEVGAAVKSLIGQEVSPGWFLDSISVIWNSTSAEFTRSVEGFSEFLADSELSPELVHHFVEQNRGIPFARNRALEVARQQEISWVLFVDDDCVAYPDLLEKLTHWASDTDVAVVAGGWEFEAIGKISPWLPLKTFGPKGYRLGWFKAEAGDNLPSAYTRNVLFSLDAFLKLGVGDLRFAEAAASTGGSDEIFFLAVSRAGGKVLYAPDARVVEYFSGQRLGLRWHLLRRIRTTQQKLRRSPVTQEKVFPRSAFMRLIGGFPIAVGILGLSPVLIFWEKPRRLIGWALLQLAPFVALALLFAGYAYEEYNSRFSQRGEV